MLFRCLCGVQEGDKQGNIIKCENCKAKYQIIESKDGEIEVMREIREGNYVKKNNTKD